MTRAWRLRIQRVALGLGVSAVLFLGCTGRIDESALEPQMTDGLELRLPPTATPVPPQPTPEPTSTTAPPRR